jgi:hypothetical protein
MANAANARANAMRIQADLAMTQVSECPSLKGKALTKTSAKHWSDHPEIGEHDHKARLNRSKVSAGGASGDTNFDTGRDDASLLKKVDEAEAPLRYVKNNL